MPLRCAARDEDPECSLADMLTLLSRFLFVLVLIAFSSSPLTISPSDGGDGERRLILPPESASLQDDALLTIVFTKALAYL